MENPQIVGAYRKLEFPEQMEDIYTLLKLLNNTTHNAAPEDWRFHITIAADCNRANLEDPDLNQSKKEELETLISPLMSEAISLNGLRAVTFGNMKLRKIAIVSEIDSPLQEDRRILLDNIKQVYGVDPIKVDRRVNARIGKVIVRSRVDSILDNINSRIPDEVLLTPVKLKYLPKDRCWKNQPITSRS